MLSSQRVEFLSLVVGAPLAALNAALAAWLGIYLSALSFLMAVVGCLCALAAVLLGFIMRSFRLKLPAETRQTREGLVFGVIVFLAMALAAVPLSILDRHIPWP